MIIFLQAYSKEKLFLFLIEQSPRRLFRHEYSELEPCELKIKLNHRRNAQRWTELSTLCECWKSAYGMYFHVDCLVF
jgi:hypothetical protein